jgi:hypothetical protein
MVDAINSIILSGQDPHFIDYKKIFNPLQAIKLWVGAITSKNTRAYHFITTSSTNAVLKDLIYIAMQYQDIWAAYIASIAYHYRIESISTILEHQFVIHPKRAIKLAHLCTDYIIDEKASARRTRQGLFYKINQQKAQSNLSILVFGVYARMLWRRFIEKSLRPESSYIKTIHRRFSACAKEFQ